MQQLPANAIQLIEAGRLIDAIKLVRQELGVDLKGAKDLVDAYRLSHPTVSDPPPPSPWTKADGIPPDVMALIQVGRKMDAIKLLRQKAGCGLKDAADIVGGRMDFEAQTRIGLGGVENTARNWRMLIALILAIAAGIAAYRWMTAQ